jgi:hypothetical protein
MFINIKPLYCHSHQIIFFSKLYNSTLIQKIKIPWPLCQATISDRSKTFAFRVLLLEWRMSETWEPSKKTRFPPPLEIKCVVLLSWLSSLIYYSAISSSCLMSTAWNWHTTSHPGGPGSRPGSMWGLWWTKRHWGRFSPSTSVSPANHSTDFFIIIITRGWHNRPISGRSAEWTQLDSTSHYTN